MKAIIVNKSPVPLHGVQPNGRKVIEVGKSGQPREKHWRRRIEDGSAEMEVVKKTETKTKKTIKEEYSNGKSNK